MFIRLRGREIECEVEMDGYKVQDIFDPEGTSLLYDSGLSRSEEMDLCILCPKETRWGQYIYVDDSRFFVCSKCIKWTRDNDADLERLVREQVGETQ